MYSSVNASFGNLITSLVIFLLIFSLYSTVLLAPSYGSDDFNIDAAGDWGCTSNTINTVNEIKARAPELVLALGDYSYQPTAKCWLDIIKPIDSITKINIGNHEDEKIEDYSRYIKHFGLSSPYYSFNFRNVHVLTMMIQVEGHSTDDPQYHFVVNDLRSASKNPDIDWIIVSAHQWFYRSSNIDGYNDGIAYAYVPVFDKYGVDLVLSGHDHKYHRTYTLRDNKTDSTNPIVTDRNSNDYNNPKGRIYAVVGTGGVNLSPVSGNSTYIAYSQGNYFGSLDILITNNGKKLVGRYFSNDGSKLDEFNITKT